MDTTDNNIDILYIEDDEVDIENVQREFKKLNSLLNIAIAHDGVDALNKLYGRNGEKKLDPMPKIILLDIRMPKMNGMEFLNTLRADQDFRDVRVYIVTMSYNTQEKIGLCNLNVAGCIVKPFEHADALNIYWALFHKE